MSRVFKKYGGEKDMENENNEKAEKFKKLVDSLYRFIHSDDPEETKIRIKESIDLLLTLYHSCEDNDKPVIPYDFR